MLMKKISALQKELDSLRKQLIDGPRPNGLFLMPDSPTHSGAPHIEIIGDEYHFVVTERGSEFERRKTKDPDELLYWFVSGDVSQLARDWELERRVEGQDSRRLWFAKEVEMLRLLNTEWAKRKELHQNSVLREHPFNDNI
jgi:hypothetical protein